eukprot:350184-Pelagomonas_calceolata.AAC.1
MSQQTVLKKWHHLFFSLRPTAKASSTFKNVWIWNVVRKGRCCNLGAGRQLAWLLQAWSCRLSWVQGA